MTDGPLMRRSDTEHFATHTPQGLISNLDASSEPVHRCNTNAWYMTRHGLQCRHG